jgi:heterotetrameric sarcosine oxidase gamma subunit
MANPIAVTPVLAAPIERFIADHGVGGVLTLGECVGRTITRLEGQADEDSGGAFRGAFGREQCAVNRCMRLEGAIVQRVGPTVLWVSSDRMNPREVSAWMEQYRRAISAAEVDISHGMVALSCRGDGVADALQAGIPADLHEDAFPVDAVMRTVFDGHAITLHRHRPSAFDLYVGRSLAGSFWERFALRLAAAL